MASTPNDNGITIGNAPTGPKAVAGSAAQDVTMANAAKPGIRGTISDYATRGIDVVAGAAGRGDDPRVGKAKDFVRAKPLAVAAAAGVIGLALLNTLRGAGRGRA